MTIEVGDQDIVNGSANSSHSCPIALALMRSVRSTWAPTDFPYGQASVLVLKASCFVGTKRFLLPAIARTFVKRLDAGETVKPFTFRLDIDHAL